MSKKVRLLCLARRLGGCVAGFAWIDTNAEACHTVLYGVELRRRLQCPKARFPRVESLQSPL